MNFNNNDKYIFYIFLFYYIFTNNIYKTLPDMAVGTTLFKYVTKKKDHSYEAVISPLEYLFSQFVTKTTFLLQYSVASWNLDATKHKWLISLDHVCFLLRFRKLAVLEKYLLLASCTFFSAACGLTISRRWNERNETHFEKKA